MDQHRTPRQREPLTRHLVLSTALAIVDEDGLDALTMRRLGQRLERDPMALYRHAENRADLLDGVVEVVFAELDVPVERAEWQAALRSTAHRFRALALAHPNVVPLLATRPLATPLGLRPMGTLRPLEQILTLLIDAGFDPPAALRAYRTYFGMLLGHVLTELQELVVDPDESDALLRLGLYRLPARDFPHLRALAEALTIYDGGGELDDELNILFDGLSARLTEGRPTDSGR